ncbi:ferritin-like domain-containing protein [Phanerochaete sordida]|uniref:Ferritin-like domain-containing protein n=1 Tax=Phanerochaete sordida TaxID=48140 RepID=A0A9P3GEZ5_9APHY|nr:ferritin-like domain-containing protein [Phanerochaete sordida]
MLLSRTFALLAAAIGVLAAPQLVTRDATKPSDTEVLQYALTLELLENAFYTEGLDKLDEKAFEAAGYPPWVRARFEQIKGHEATHVAFLNTALGAAAPKPCTYKFPYTDPKSFAAVAMVLETVGASAYIGAAQLLDNKDTLTAAASILGIESRQAAWVASAVLKGSAWDGPFETPLSMDGVYSLASQFIVSCPSTNAPLMVTALPALALAPAAPAAGATAKFTYDHTAVTAPGPLFAAWFDGVGVQYTDLAADGSAGVPAGLQGTVYAAVVADKAGSPTAQKLLTGLATFQIAVGSGDANL